MNPTEPQIQAPATNGATAAPLAMQTVKPSRFGAVDVHLHFPSHDREIVVKKKIALDGWYKDERAAIEVALHPGMASNQGQTIHIDAESGVQIKYTGLRGWIGLDGRYAYAAKTKKDAQDLVSARQKDNTRQVIWLIGAIIVQGLGLIILAAMAAG
jgi:hypothetical protein